jgi:putative ABC transport system ATP-binding protein
MNVTTVSPSADVAPDQDPDRALFRCSDLSRTFGAGDRTVVAVHGASCAVAPGARIALTGPSGSGKSTLLHLMAGLDQPTGGQASWPGLGGDPGRHRDLVGVVFQAPSLLDPLDVVENVELPLLLSGVTMVEARRRARSALATLHLTDLATKLPEELSGGQAQRVAVARVLAGQPRLILADEPTGQLDRHTGDQVITALLHAAYRLDAALVVATHDQAVAERFDEQWAVVDGRLDPAAAETGVHR